MGMRGIVENVPIEGDGYEVVTPRVPIEGDGYEVELFEGAH